MKTSPTFDIPDKRPDGNLSILCALSREGKFDCRKNMIKVNNKKRLIRFYGDTKRKKEDIEEQVDDDDDIGNAQKEAR